MSIQTDYYIPQMEKMEAQISLQASEITKLRDAYKNMNDAFIAVDDENARLRAVLTQFVACCDTAPPTSLMIELSMACTAARAALSRT